MGFSILTLGIYPTLDELLRIIFSFFSPVSILPSGLRSRHSVFHSLSLVSFTSALAGLAVWLFYTVSYSMIMNLIGNAHI